MQLTTQDIEQIRGQPLYSSEGEKVADIEDVFLDEQTGAPEWVRLSVGLFGLKDVLVPITSLERYDGGLRASYSKDMIKDAPRVDQGYVSPEQESELYRYYGLAAASPSELNERRGSPDDPIQQGPPSFPTGGEAPSERPDSPVFHEEQSLLAKGEVDPQHVRLRKYGG